MSTEQYKPFINKPSVKGNSGTYPGQIVNENEDEDFRKQLEEAIKLHKLAVDGDKEAVGTAHELLKKLYAKYPQNRLTQAYLGSITSLKSRDLLDMIERFKFATKGVKLLNQAVLGDKDNIEIRILRANVCFRLPEMYFHKTAIAVEDYNYILERYEKDNNTVTHGLYLRILYDLGCAYRNLELAKQANVIWDKLLACEGGDAYKEMILDKNGDAAHNGSQAPAETQKAGNDQTMIKREIQTDVSLPKKKVWTKL